MHAAVPAVAQKLTEEPLLCATPGADSPYCRESAYPELPDMWHARVQPVGYWDLSSGLIEASTVWPSAVDGNPMDPDTSSSR